MLERGLSPNTRRRCLDLQVEEDSEEEKTRYYCNVCYNDCTKDLSPMICCKICNFWVHADCDGISYPRGFRALAAIDDPYKCPRCTGDPPGKYGADLEEELEQDDEGDDEEQ